jgi:divinyl chlorophyllide a 8-vinyl-reductase
MSERTHHAETRDAAASLSGDSANRTRPRRVLVLGGTGTIGRATVRALVSRGHETVCLVRPGAEARTPEGATARVADVTDPASLARDGLRGERFDVLVSCLASRTGLPADAWAIDHRAQVNALRASEAAGVRHVVLLSAICVQKPVLAFQHAKLAFEAELIASGLDYTIVRPTAFFKSLSGQVERVRRGKPFLVFGNGAITACKPIADDDLGAYLAECLDRDDRRNRILPIGGPGAAITPRAQGEHLFALLGREPRFTHVPVALLDVIVTILAILGRWLPALAAKAELARIGRYYATESMLVLDPATGRYEAHATPSTGSQTLFDHYARLVRGGVTNERGDHAVF